MHNFKCIMVGDALRDGSLSIHCMTCLYTCLYDRFKMFRDGPPSMGMIDSRCLETGLRLWVVHALSTAADARHLLAILLQAS